jgi:hypothetical protein
MACTQGEKLELPMLPFTVQLLPFRDVRAVNKTECIPFEHVVFSQPCDLTAEVGLASSLFHTTGDSL